MFRVIQECNHDIKMLTDFHIDSDSEVILDGYFINLAAY